LCRVLGALRQVSRKKHEHEGGQMGLFTYKVRWETGMSRWAELLWLPLPWLSKAGAASWTLPYPGPVMVKTLRRPKALGSVPNLQGQLAFAERAPVCRQ
jgi:hypothetical protein